MDELTDLSGGGYDNVIDTNIRRSGEKITWIVNGYDQTTAHSAERPARKLNCHSVLRQGGTVLAGDINGHSIPWDPRCQVQHNAAFWEDVIDEDGLEIGNEGRSPYFWTRDGHEDESVIDLTLGNRPVTILSTLVDDQATGSQHEVIESEVEVDRQ